MTRTARNRNTSQSRRGESARGRKPNRDRRSDRVGGRTTASQPRHIDLCIHRIECVDDTSEFNKDEIILTAIETMAIVKETRGKKTLESKSRRGRTIDAGKFKKGTKQDYREPKTIARLPIGGASADWPRYYPVTLLLVEKDEGTIGTIVNKTIDAIDEKATTAVATAAASAAGTVVAGAVGAGAAAGSVVPLVGTAVGAAVGAAMGAAFGAIKKSRADDVFPPKNLNLELKKQPTAKGSLTARKVKTFSGFKGKYRVSFSWKAT